MTFREEGAQPVVAALRYDIGESHVELQRKSLEATELVTPNGRALLPYGFSHALNVLERPSRFMAETTLEEHVLEYLEYFIGLWANSKDDRRRRMSGVIPRPLRAVAPLRAKPKAYL